MRVARDIPMGRPRSRRPRESGDAAWRQRRGFPLSRERQSRNVRRRVVRAARALPARWM